MIVPLPKKGDLADCNNWQGTTLLSVAGSVCLCTAGKNTRKAVGTNLRQEQAGFRPGRSCNDQILALRQIIEKVTALQKPVMINFIDFKKALDCIHRPSVWAILRHYGIPEGIVTIIQNLYKDSKCNVKINGVSGELFEVVTGVR